jgi:hypothetical protein
MRRAPQAKKRIVLRDAGTASAEVRRDPPEPSHLDADLGLIMAKLSLSDAAEDDLKENAPPQRKGQRTPVKRDARPADDAPASRGNEAKVHDRKGRKKKAASRRRRSGRRALMRL